jgi:hypothetical protein
MTGAGELFQGDVLRSKGWKTVLAMAASLAAGSFAPSAAVKDASLVAPQPLSVHSLLSVAEMNNAGQEGQRDANVTFASVPELYQRYSVHRPPIRRKSLVPMVGFEPTPSCEHRY